ncbi:MAG: hypothetical protein NTV80_17855 [Verrucomicrobia bacterium]|nr:hypothetical protein [Verrucomicrobiota bacterium]
MKKPLLILVLVAVAAATLTWLLTAPDHEFAPSTPKARHKPERTTASTVSVPIPARTPPPSSRAIDPEIQKLADRLVEKTQTPLNDLETLGEFVDLYRKAFSQLPVGCNEDITAILTGSNPIKGVLFPPDSPMIIKGQIVDRWGTPYWLHPNSGARLEIRSAGPDKDLFTGDDLMINPSPSGLGVTPAQRL